MKTLKNIIVLSALCIISYYSVAQTSDFKNKPMYNYVGIHPGLAVLDRNVIENFNLRISAGVLLNEQLFVNMNRNNYSYFSTGSSSHNNETMKKTELNLGRISEQLKGSNWYGGLNMFDQDAGNEFGVHFGGGLKSKFKVLNFFSLAGAFQAQLNKRIDTVTPVLIEPKIDIYVFFSDYLSVQYNIEGGMPLYLKTSELDGSGHVFFSTSLGVNVHF